MANQRQPSGFTVGSLAHSVRMAAEILQRVSVQIIEPPGLGATVAEQASVLDTLLPALDSIGEERRLSTPVWSLDHAWVDTAFAVAATRPRVLLTIASNAVAALRAEFDDAAEETWPDGMERVLDQQRTVLRDVQARLIEARVSYLAPAEDDSRR